MQFYKADLKNEDRKGDIKGPQGTEIQTKQIDIYSTERNSTENNKNGKGKYLCMDQNQLPEAKMHSVPSKITENRPHLCPKKVISSTF